MDIMKSPGLGREKAILGKGVFTEQQKGVTLQLRNRGFEFIAIEKSFNKEPLENFLGSISS
jgi:hypothetical protein